MNLRIYPAFARAASIATVLLAGALGFTTPAGAALSPSAFGVGRLCSAPSPGYSGCLGLRLVAKQPLSLRGSRTSTPAASAAIPAVKKVEFTEPWKGSLSPQGVLTAYGLAYVPAPAHQQTLALIDAYNDPTIEHDLAVFDKEYELPACTAANGCFTKVAIGSPATNAGWAQETSADVELAHGLCPSCKIMLVQARSNENADLEAAEAEAERLGANEISNSWGGPEVGETTTADDASPFNHPDTVITAAAGDDGYLDWDAEEPSEHGYPDYPASSPHVIAVGGTRLSVNETNGAWSAETVWNGDGASGGGCSTVFAAQPWQQSVADWSAVGCATGSQAKRAVADVSADADPYTGEAIYDSTPVREGNTEYRGWTTIGGTSVASPTIAATFALAGGAGTGAGGKAIAYPAQTLYENLAAHPQALHDVVSGSNGACGNGFDAETGLAECSPAEEDGSCSDTAICVARVGYDGPSGVGTPDGIAAFKPDEEEGKQQNEEKRIAEETRIAEEKRTAAEEKQRKEEALLAEEKQGEEERRREEQKNREQEEEEQKKQGSGAGGSGAGASGPGIGPSSAGNPATPIPSGSPLTTGVPSTAPLSTTPSASTITPILSAPALTETASEALSHGKPKVSQIAFAFTLNVAAHVQVKLAKQVVTHGRKRWQTLPYALTITGARGRDSSRLSAHAALAPGRYRLTLTPVGGVTRTLTFPIG